MSISRNQAFDFDISNYPQLPRAKGIFVTGTDTEVGKTLIAGAIARQLRLKGRSVGVFKPVASGCRHRREGLVSSDAEFLSACAESMQRLSEVTPLCYRLALSPNVAAEREHREVDLQAIFTAYKELAAKAEVVVVEGVGGLLCPISNDFWVIHLARMLQLPVVIVARAGMGTINHTLLTLHAARSAGLEVAGVVINRYRLEPVPGMGASSTGQAAVAALEPYLHGDEELTMYTNPAQIAERGKVSVLAIVPDEQESSVEKSAIGPDVSFAISTVNWEAIAGI